MKRIARILERFYPHHSVYFLSFGGTTSGVSQKTIKRTAALVKFFSGIPDCLLIVSIDGDKLKEGSFTEAVDAFMQACKAAGIPVVLIAQVSEAAPYPLDTEEEMERAYAEYDVPVVFVVVHESEATSDLIASHPQFWDLAAKLWGTDRKLGPEGDLLRLSTNAGYLLLAILARIFLYGLSQRLACTGQVTVIPKILIICKQHLTQIGRQLKPRLEGGSLEYAHPPGGVTWAEDWASEQGDPCLKTILLGELYLQICMTCWTGH